MRSIAPYVHTCTIQDGDMAGNTYRREVSGHDYEYEETCQHCKELLVTTPQLLAHIYYELTDE